MLRITHIFQYAVPVIIIYNIYTVLLASRTAGSCQNQKYIYGSGRYRTGVCTCMTPVPVTFEVVITHKVVIKYSIINLVGKHVQWQSSGDEMLGRDGMFSINHT
jgi:hypothetical protein